MSRIDSVERWGIETDVPQAFMPAMFGYTQWPKDNSPDIYMELTAYGQQTDQ